MKHRESRSQKRLSKRLPIKFGTATPDTLGFIKNLSLDGVAISSKVIFKPQTLLSLLIQCEPKPIGMRGIVRWTSDITRKMTGSGSFMEMGIYFIEKDPAYLSLLQDVVEKFREGRREPRFEKVFKVSFEDPKKLLDEYTQNISAGGMYIVSEDPPSVDSEVEVNILMMQEATVIHVAARVVHVVDSELSERIGMPPGFGVQFIRFFDDDEREFRAYISSLKDRMGLNE